MYVCLLFKLLFITHIHINTPQLLQYKAVLLYGQRLLGWTDNNRLHKNRRYQQLSCLTHTVLISFHQYTCTVSFSFLLWHGMERCHRCKLSSTSVNFITGVTGMMQVCVFASVACNLSKNSFYFKAHLFEIQQQIIITNVSIIISSSHV